MFSAKLGNTLHLRPLSSDALMCSQADSAPHGRLPVLERIKRNELINEHDQPEHDLVADLGTFVPQAALRQKRAWPAANPRGAAWPRVGAGRFRQVSASVGIVWGKRRLLLCANVLLRACKTDPHALLSEDKCIEKQKLGKQKAEMREKAES